MTFYFRRWNKFGLTVISAELQSIFSILSTKKVEKLAQREGRSVESGIDGIAFLCRMVFTVADNLFGFFHFHLFVCGCTAVSH